MEERKKCFKFGVNRNIPTLYKGARFLGQPVHVWCKFGKNNVPLVSNR